MVMDLNDTPEQREFGAVIPDGTFVKVKGHLKPGGNNLVGADKMDEGLFKQSATSDAAMLQWDFVILHGPYVRKHVFQNTVVAGGSVDEKGNSKAGNISKAMFRAMIDSALGLDPKDMSEPTKAKRVLRGFWDLDGIEFVARIGVEKGGERPGGGNYPDRNTISRVVVPNDPEWQPVMSGQEVEAKPSGALAARPMAQAQPSRPTWGNGAAAPTAQSAQPAAVTAGGPAWLRG
jgi:hypothetical protein